MGKSVPGRGNSQCKEGTASAKTLRQDCAWPVGGTARTPLVWLIRVSEGVGRAGRARQQVLKGCVEEDLGFSS